MTDELQKMQGQATDLAKTAEQREAEQRVRDEAAQRAAMIRVAAWDRAMSRAFKGIVPNHVRRQMMVRAAERADA